MALTPSDRLAPLAELEEIGGKEEPASPESDSDAAPAVGPATELKFLASERERQSAAKVELFEAARAGDVAGLRRALLRGAVSINAEDRTTCMWTALHHAAENGSVPAIAFLIRQARAARCHTFRPPNSVQTLTRGAAPPARA